MTRLPIVVSGWGRTVALARALAAVFFAIAFVAFAFTDEIDSVSQEDDAVRLVTGLCMAGACAWVAWLVARPALVRRAYLELAPDKLVVVHPGLLKRPLEIHRSYVKAAAVDPRPWRWRWLGNKGRFHLGGPGEATPEAAVETGPIAASQDQPRWRRLRGKAMPDDVPEWLFSVVGGSPLPLLSTVDDVPNIAFLFEEPIRMVSVRRGTRPFATKGPVHVITFGRAARGLLVKAKDPAAAEQALAAWTTMRPLTTADVLTIQPDEEYARRARKSRRVVNVWLGILLFFLVGGPVLSELAEQASTTSP